MPKLNQFYIDSGYLQNTFGSFIEVVNRGFCAS